MVLILAIVLIVCFAIFLIIGTTSSCDYITTGSLAVALFAFILFLTTARLYREAEEKVHDILLNKNVTYYDSLGNYHYKDSTYYLILKEY